MGESTRRQRLEEMLAAEPDDVELRYMLGMEHVSGGDAEGRGRLDAPAAHLRAVGHLDRVLVG